MHAPLGKFLRKFLKFSEMQSSAFWMLKFLQMPGFHIEHVILKYFINHKRGAGPSPKSALVDHPF